jgi:hypothetical protein
MRPSPSPTARTTRSAEFFRRRPESRRAGQRHRQTPILPVPVRIDRQPLACRGGNLHRWRSSHPRPGDPQADRDAVAAIAEIVGALALSIRDQINAKIGTAAARRAFWEAFVDRAFGGDPTAGQGVGRSASPMPSAFLRRCNPRPSAASRSSARDPAMRAADTEGRARPAGGRRHSLRRPRFRRGAGARPPGGKAHAGGQARRPNQLQTGGYQRDDDPASQGWKTCGAPEIR